MDEGFIKQIEQTVKQNRDLPSFSDNQVATLNYSDVATKIEKIHIIFEKIPKKSIKRFQYQLSQN